MKPGIYITREWSDDDLIELRICVSDGTSFFCSRIYVGHAILEDTVSSLRVFKDRLRGGLLDVRLGEFGPEYASGAFHARFHFAIPGRLFVSCMQESEFMRFGSQHVASKATMYVRSEPALLDRFISELQAVCAGLNEDACLEAIQHRHAADGALYRRWHQ